MPRIDPLQLLNCLNVLLTPNGGIKSEQEVARISSLMEKFSKKLVSKCVYLLILKSSDIHLLSKFMGLGGWNLIYNWLLHAVEAKNYPFLIELLEVIIICPVDIERLKSNPMPRQIKFLSKDSTVDSRVRDLASDIVKHWLAIVKGTPATSTPVNEGGVTAKQDIGSASRTQQSVENIRPLSSTENTINEQRVSVDGSNDEVDDTNYVKSTSPSTSSAESDESDVFVPYKKTPIKNRNKVAITDEKVPTKRPCQEDKSKLKSKLIQNADSKDSKKASIKLRIEKKADKSLELKLKKDEKTLEEKIKEKRRLKDEKEKQKFAKYKHEREKKEKQGKERRTSTTDGKSGKEKSQDDKLKGDLSKLIPRSLDKLGRIPKKPKESDFTVEDKSPQQRKDDGKEKAKVEEKKNVKKEEKQTTLKSKESEAKKEKEKDSKKTSAAPPKKPVSMSVEKRFATEAKPKTVKAYNSKFRLTGLEQESTPKPPARKSSSSSSNSSSSSSKDKNAVKRSPTKDAEGEPVEKRLKSPDISIAEDKNSPVAAKVKKPFLQESDVFMNAMNVALETQKESLRKRKKPTQKPDAETKSSDAASSPTIKTEKDVKPSFKFYKDTLDLVNDENNLENIKEEADPLSASESQNETEEDYKDVKINIDSDQPRLVDGLKSSLSIFRFKKHPKKSVRWKRDDELEAIQYFEVDATERTNVVRTFWDMQMMERSKERESLLQARKNAENDKMAVQTKWKPLIPIDIPPSTTVRGANSQEKNIQYARERSVPPAIYFNKSIIPDTPIEPDLEIHPVTTPPVIPLDDISGSQDSINDFSTYRWPDPKQFPADNIDMNMMNAGFVPNAGMPPPMFPPFPDGTFPPPFGQPFFPGGPVGPMPVPPSNWPTGNNDQNQQTPNSMPMNWPPPNVVPPPVGPPGMMGPPPFGLMAPPFPPIPGPGFPGAPNMFPPANVNQQQMPNTSPTSDNQQYSNNNYPNNSENNKKWNNDDRYYRKDGWKNNYSDRDRDKRGSGNWRGTGGNSRLCRIFQKKGYCSVNGCRFYHPEK